MKSPTETLKSQQCTSAYYAIAQSVRPTTPGNISFLKRLVAVRRSAVGFRYVHELEVQREIDYLVSRIFL
jgi:hypothetical protein